MLGGGGDPTGQVVAKLGGEEITALELRQELGGFVSRDPNVMKAAQQRALQQIIMRRLIVKEAKAQKLDEGANYALQRQRQEEGLLGQLYQRKIASSIAAPTRAEAENYISSNPEKFANRRTLIVDQLIVAPNSISADRFRPLNTLEEVRALLSAEKVPHQANVATLDTLSIDPRLIEQINKLPPGEVFIVPQRGAFVFNRIVDTRPAPFQGDLAVTYAINVLRSQRAQEAAVRQLDLLRKNADKSISYAEAYKPAPPPAKKAAAPSSPAPGAASVPAKAAPSGSASAN
jgi:EpsD family peptidyl-prolyl cis-trans isomerase